MTRRCPNHRCEYCTDNRLHSTRVREQSADDSLAEHEASLREEDETIEMERLAILDWEDWKRQLTTLDEYNRMMEARYDFGPELDFPQPIQFYHDYIDRDDPAAFEAFYAPFGEAWHLERSGQL